MKSHAPAEEPKLPTKESRMVGFRLDKDSHEVLCRHAAELKISKHDLGRIYVMEVLQQHHELAALWSAIKLTSDNLMLFREDFFHALEALLVSAGKVKPAEAQKWIGEHFTGVERDSPAIAAGRTLGEPAVD